MNFDKARFNMVEQQVRTWRVLDQRVLDVLLNTPREAFVPEAYRALAYADTNIPLPDEQVMMAPVIEARMLQALEIHPADRILEIGTGSGYVTALLAQLGQEVVSIEVNSGLAEQATRNLGMQGMTNAEVLTGDGARGWADRGPYDVIAVTGSMPLYDEVLQDQLNPGGRLFAIVGDAPAMDARLVTRSGDNDWAVESLLETVLPPLQGVAEPERFVF